MPINNAGGKCNYHHSGMIMVLISNGQLQRRSITHARRVDPPADRENFSPSTPSSRFLVACKKELLALGGKVQSFIK